jgi:hypothetical protein
MRLSRTPRTRTPRTNAAGNPAPGNRAAIPVVATVLAALALTACGGESEQAKAEKSACEAKTAISTSVQSLQRLTPQTATIAAVQGAVGTISENLQKLKQAEEKLSGPRKEEIEQANETLSSELSALKGELTTLTPTNIASKLTTAVEKLATSYKQALAPIQC